ncbi:MAG: hypothetical protein DWQ36_17460 [Acidobacteria bacterium]|nr:MAG: hypothetical protein DWQ30_16090 [Acidobacteriota bacterium]REK04232.1 MAG: hypothetical protein DWQ36_17460 [Acidobacteriota bacterium]
MTRLASGARQLTGAALLAALLAAGGCAAPEPGAAPDPTAASGESSGADAASRLEAAQRLLASRAGENLLASIDDFERLLADPELTEVQRAVAAAGLAEASALVGLYSLLPPAETMPRAEQAAAQALELAPEDARTHAVQGLVRYLWSWDFDGAAVSFERAISLDPGLSTAHLWWAMMLSAEGRHDEALQRVEEGRAASGYASRLLETKTVTLLVAADRLEQARVQVAAVLEAHPEVALGHRELGLLELAAAEGTQVEADPEARRRHLEAARDAFVRAGELSGGDARSTAGLAHAAGKLGERERAEAAIAELDQRATREFVPPLYQALARLGLDDRSAALDLVEQALEIRDPGLVYLRTRPGLRSLDGDPRFERVAAAVGI